jgi:glycosyltransferase involved in cell wall biosynthesis
MTDTAERSTSTSCWPRTLHVGNVANVAYGYAKVLARRGASVELICHDVTHLMSQPEWDDLALDPKDFPDENRFDINTADFGDYRRPAWFKSETLSGGMPGLRSALVRLAARHLPSHVKRRLEPLYYRMRRLRDQASRQGRAAPAAEETSAIGVETLTATAAQLGPDWRIDTNALAAYSRQGGWLVSHARQADVIFCYALAAIYSLYCRDKPCVSVDIGTMRDIPFGSTGLSRLLWLAYRLCDHIIITNPDTRRLAEAVGIRNYSFCPHPIDETVFYPAEASAWRRQLQDRYAVETLLLAPARQNWRLKGNDKIFRGFALALKAGTKAVLLVPGWGQEVARSKRLCRRLGIADRVIWLSPMPEPLLARYYRAVDLVLDQFELGVFGLITPKAMACGAAVLTSYDERHNAWCFPTPPPLVRCSSSEDVASAVVRLAGDSQARRAIGAASHAWVSSYHSSDLVAARLVDAMQSARRNFAQRMRSGP